MNPLWKLEVEEILNTFPEVKWDRWTGNASTATFYGWIDREDGRSDFMLIRWADGQIYYVTSSARYSEEFSKRCGCSNHKPCKIIGDSFSGVNKVRAPKVYPGGGLEQDPAPGLPQSAIRN